MSDVINTSIAEINAFLIRFKFQLVNGIEFVPRTYDGITMLGLDITLAKAELFDLTYLDYDRGPTLDHNGDGTDIWEFGKEIDGQMAYIKIKLTNDNECKVLSFKPSTGPFKLPYQK
ncbi:hypothetical protein ROU88_00900 [Macrococcus capreoli]|uniref:hypothetical protein n=1 Tax=Macrococcus capreoli TaxID=2982690 RepID=UPI003EE4CCAF